MAMKALLQGDAGNYRIRGAIWEFGTVAYRAYVHLVPAAPRSGVPRRVVSADGVTLQDVLGATKARVYSVVGAPVESLEVQTAASPEPDSGPSAQPLARFARRRYPPPTD
ncbi:MAG TPA: hypothetical protein VLD36_15730 [Burkholderiales bacterium]|jgi:hypothetical protein|nr:hypothetical protein [Burkholderiales bacterium]